MVSQAQQTVKLNIVACDGHLEGTPTEVELCLLVCPEGSDTQLELLSVGFRANTLPDDADGTILIDLEWIDDSINDDITVLESAFSLENLTNLVNNEVWRGHQLMDSGDAINVVFSVSTAPISTPGQGCAFVVEYRVVRHSG